MESFKAPLVPACDIRDALAAIYRRISWRILPFLLSCYVLAYLDRVNISFAKLQMQQQLGMSDAVYGLGAGVFFLGYMLFEVPSNLLLARVGARKTISRIMVMWGLTSACMIFVHDTGTFYILRFLLGVFEAGFAPGMIFYLTYWYPESRRARVMAVVLMAGPVAGIVGGPLSTWIMTVCAGLHGLAGWQWLFLLEGSPCVLLGAAALVFLDDTPQQARWLSDEDKAHVTQDIGQSARPGVHSSFGAALKDGRVYLMAFSYFCLICGLYTISFWLPTLLRTAGVKDALLLGRYAALPYLVTVAAVPVFARRSDRLRERCLHSALPAIAGALSLIAAAYMTRSLIGSIISMTVATTCIYAAYVVFWAIPTAYLKGAAAAGGIALINSMGLLGGFISPVLIGWLKTLTGSLQIGLIVMATLLVVGAISILLNRLPRVVPRAS
ncbi:MFS transporter [Caballeronia sordidicola]|uniref:Nitrate/nitrite transporter n=1 Tax=Caballeronia sordidicola TaxID=196367 RepID=A0A242M8Z4_CABSO|nr:MFS transporter [Caballeronia sordidicola]OTP67675.1 Nitrate/nitrite transporter [Caballeronia sordidicola]OTP67706.1 Nitrate/nitrite transporter [Caballeronia sordidicola]